MQGPTLHLVCGKIAAGKSTLTRKLATEPGTVLISEDEWLHTLYAGEISALADYVRCSGRLREVMGRHVVQLLQAGVSVVLDFPANTLKVRAWMRGIIEAAKVDHRLYFLDVPDAECKARLRQRNAAGTHAFETSEAQFDAITGFFVPPTAEEGFTVVTMR